jgi:preprotein translocase subunit SecA
MSECEQVDSLLIDEARNPLIISELVDDDEYQAKYPKAAQVAAQLKEGVHYEV